MSEHGGLGHNGGPSLDDLAASWSNAAHSIFGPSSSAMYLTCLGSLVPNLQAADRPSYAAAEGTIAHMVADHWLRLGKHAADDLLYSVHEQDGFEIAVTPLMLTDIQPYVDWCLAAEGDHYFETKIDISPLTPLPRQFGTADHYALTFGHMTITDLKYGEGVKVYAAEDRADTRAVIISNDWNPDDVSGLHHYDYKLNGNTQALLYAAGVFLEWDWFYHFETITIRICQPRLDHFDVWETTREDLLRFMDWAKARMRLAWTPNQPRTPSGKGCRWCKIEKNCPALLAWQADNISGRFQDLDAVEAGTYTHDQMATVIEMISDPTVLLLEPIDIQTLSIDQMANILRYRGLIEGWFRKIAAHLMELADGDNDMEIPFWKVVEGRSNRKFGDKTRAESELIELGLTEEQIWVHKMISPNQAEDLIRAKRSMSKNKASGLIEHLVVQPPGPRSLAPVGDKRQEITPDGDRFDDLDAVDEQ